MKTYTVNIKIIEEIDVEAYSEQDAFDKAEAIFRDQLICEGRFEEYATIEKPTDFDPNDLN